MSTGQTDTYQLARATQRDRVEDVPVCGRRRAELADKFFRLIRRGGITGDACEFDGFLSATRGEARKDVIALAGRAEVTRVVLPFTWIVPPDDVGACNDLIRAQEPVSPGLRGFNICVRAICRNSAAV